MELPNPHYYFELDFESAEEMDWQRSSGYRGVKYLSKEGQRKENRRDWMSMRQFQRRAENRDRRLMGLLPPRRASGTHNRKHRIQQPLRQPPLRQWINPQNNGSIPNGENMFADLFFFSLL